jgi:hypothetical protein
LLLLSYLVTHNTRNYDVQLVVQCCKLAITMKLLAIVAK